MARRLTPEEIEGLLGAYALGAVDEDERAQVEAYVADHPASGEELERLQEAAVWLAASGAPASRDLWDKIAAATKPEPLPLRVPERRRESRTRSWFRQPRVLVPAAALVIGGAVGIAAVVSRDASPKRADLASAIADGQDSSSARRVVLESSSGDAKVEAVILRDGAGVLVTSDLPKLAAGRTYQLWGIDGSTVVSLGVLGRRVGPSAFTFVGTPKALAITEEVAGGAAQPENPPVVSGRVPA